MAALPWGVKALEGAACGLYESVGLPKPVLTPRAHQQVFLDCRKLNAREPIEGVGFEGVFGDATHGPMMHPVTARCQVPRPTYTQR